MACPKTPTRKTAAKWSQVLGENDSAPELIRVSGKECAPIPHISVLVSTLYIKSAFSYVVVRLLGQNVMLTSVAGERYCLRDDVRITHLLVPGTPVSLQGALVRILFLTHLRGVNDYSKHYSQYK